MGTRDKTLATSVGPEGNISVPLTPAETAHWEKMLRTTAKRLGDAEARKILDDLQ